MKNEMADDRQTVMVSIIVPVYNVEKYLRDCLDSLISQTYKEIEIIIIDDGSKDGSPIICDEYGMKDERISVIHKTNGGLSSARNKGLNVAKGKYVAFIDSDDICDKDFIKMLVKICERENCEIAQCLTYDFEDKKQLEHRYSYKRSVNYYSGREMCFQIFGRYGAYCVPAQDKLYRRELFESIKFPEGRLHEDEFTTYKIFWNCKRIAFICEYLYYYRTNNANSIMHRPYDERRYDGVIALEERNDFFWIKGERQLYELSVYYMWKQVMGDLLAQSDLKGNDKNIVLLLRKKSGECAQEVRKFRSLSFWKKVEVTLKNGFFPIYKYIYTVRNRNEKDSQNRFSKLWRKV